MTPFRDPPGKIQSSRAGRHETLRRAAPSNSLGKDPRITEGRRGTEPPYLWQEVRRKRLRRSRGPDTEIISHANHYLDQKHKKPQTDTPVFHVSWSIETDKLVNGNRKKVLLPSPSTASRMMKIWRSCDIAEEQTLHKLPIKKNGLSLLLLKKTTMLPFFPLDWHSR